KRHDHNPFDDADRRYVWTPASCSTTELLPFVPRSPRSVSDVNDRDLIFADTIVNNVGVTAEPERMNPELRNEWMPNWQVAKGGNSSFDICFDFAGSARVTSLNVIEDGLAIGECTGRVAYPHIPPRLLASAPTSAI